MSMNLRMTTCLAFRVFRGGMATWSNDVVDQGVVEVVLN
jgi:hypothetical protein